MFSLLRVVLVLCPAVLAAPAFAAITPADAGLAAELRAFTQRMTEAPLRTPRSFSAQLPDIRSGSDRGIATPQLEVVTGRIDNHSCLYHLRLQVQWSGRAPAGAEVEADGHSLLKRIDCARLADDVGTVALREVSTLRNRLGNGALVASDQGRGRVIATARQRSSSAATRVKRFAKKAAGPVHLRMTSALQAEAPPAPLSWSLERFLLTSPIDGDQLILSMDTSHCLARCRRAN